MTGSQPDLERRDRVVAMTRQGMSASAIAEVLHVATRTVQRDRKAGGVSKAFCGERRITPEEIERAGELLADGCSLGETARTLGRAHETIRRRYPDAVWSRAQVSANAVMARQASRVYREARPVSTCS